MNTYLPGIRKETKTLEYFSPCDASSSCVINSVRLIYVYDDIPATVQASCAFCLQHKECPILAIIELLRALVGVKLRVEKCERRRLLIEGGKND